MDPNELQQNVCEAAQLMKALGNPHRLAILCRLLEGEKSVGQLVPLIGLSQSALSQHLARLRRDRLVRTRRVAQTIYYALDGAHARAVLDTLHQPLLPRRQPVASPRWRPRSPGCSRSATAQAARRP